MELFVAFPETSPSGMIHLTAEEAVYVPPGDGPLTGGWMLTTHHAGDVHRRRRQPTSRCSGPAAVS